MQLMIYANALAGISSNARTTLLRKMKSITKKKVGKNVNRTSLAKLQVLHYLG
jgi:hypothetical protein